MHYTRVTSMYPDTADAWYMLGNINGRLGDIEQAGECARRAIALRPDFTEAHLDLGNVLLHQGRQEERLAQYCKVSSPAPRHVGAHVQSAIGRFDGVVESYRSAMDIDTSEAVFNALKPQIQALMQINRLEGAKALLASSASSRQRTLVHGTP